MHLRKSFVVLLILLISVSFFAILVHSATPPTLTATQNGNGVTVRGSMWTANALVTLYLDVVDASHKVAQVLTDYSGSFTATFPIDGTILGTHNVTAVQETTQTTAPCVVGVTSPPDDRLLNPILAISNLLGNVNTEVQKIEAKLDAGGSFYKFVDNWFTTININLMTNLNGISTKIDTDYNNLANQLNGISTKIDNANQGINQLKPEQMTMKYGQYTTTQTAYLSFGPLPENTACKFTVTIVPIAIQGSDYIMVRGRILPDNLLEYLGPSTQVFAVRR